jgi:protoheme IX farnesyltransferase
LFTTINNYINVLKPRETSLLAFIGAATAFVAARGVPPWDRLLLATVTILIASAAANGLTNYLDRHIDSLMPRTQNRALAAKRIDPAKKVLPMLYILAAAGLALAWIIHPYVFLADLIGTIVAVTFRKRVTCVFPQGAIASCAPILMGWFAITPTFNWQIALICLMIIVWLPSHVWGVMIARRDEYIKAGLTFFPMSISLQTGVSLMVFFGTLLFVASIALYFVGDFGWLYLSGTIILGTALLLSSFRLLKTSDSADAWRVYKISSFPYLGLIFLLMALDLLLL